MVGEKVNLKNHDAIMKWLAINDIEVHRVSRMKRVFEIEVDTAINILYAKALMRKHPIDWETRYLDIDKSSIAVLVVKQLKASTPVTPTTKVQAINALDKKLLRKLEQL